MDAEALIKNAPLIFGISIVGVLGFLILLAVGLNMWREERKPKDAPGDPASPPRRGLALPAFLTNWTARLPRPAAPAPSSADAHEVLRVLRHALTGRVQVEIGGRRFSQLSDVDDAGTRQGLLITLRDLQEFAGLSALPGTPAGPAASPPPATPAFTPPSPWTNASAAPALAPLEAPAAPAPAGDPAAAPSLNPLPPKPAASSSAPPPLRMPTMNPFKQMQVLREIGEPPAPKPIADQIDEILQHLTAGTPFAARNLRVSSGPRGNVVFEADGQTCNAIDDLPDPTVQSVFREAIRQWEQNN